MELSKKQLKTVFKIWVSNVLFSQIDELLEDLTELGATDLDKEYLEAELFKIASKLSLETFHDTLEIVNFVKSENQ